MILTTKHIDSDIIEEGFSKFVEMSKDVSSLNSDFWDCNKKFRAESLWEMCKKDKADEDSSRYRLGEYSDHIEYMEYVARKFLLEKEIINKNDFITRSGEGVYPPGGYMGWHTNRNRAGIRCYFNWASESGKSGLKYWYEGTDKIIRDSIDQIGWQLRMFSTDYSKPFWHAVWSDCTRLSIGFRIIKGK